MDPSQIEEILLRESAFDPIYLLEVTREGHLDTMTVHMEWSASAASGSEARKAAAAHLKHSVKSQVGISVQVRVCDPGTLDRSVGKARRVIDRRERK